MISLDPKRTVRRNKCFPDKKIEMETGSNHGELMGVLPAVTELQMVLANLKSYICSANSLQQMKFAKRTLNLY